MKVHELIDTSKRIYFEQSLYSHVINDTEISKKLLLDNRVSADRLDVKFQFVNKEDNNIKRVIEFYRNWLMYMEGPTHIYMRNNCARYLNAAVKEFDFDTFILKESEQFFLKNNHKDLSLWIDNLVSNLIAGVIGINEEEYKKLINKSKDVTTFLYNPSASVEIVEKTLEAITFTKDFLEDIYMSGKFQKNSVLHKMKKENKFSIDIIINILVDGHDPLCSAISTVLLNYFNSNLNIEENLIYSLKYYPPFTSCVRVAKDKIELENNYIINNGDYIFMVLPQEGKCPFHSKSNVSIPFGYGRHTCLGKKLTEETLKEVYKSFEKLNIRDKYALEDYNINDSFGYYSFTDISLKKVSF